jgi:hypothetical protein
MTHHPDGRAVAVMRFQGLNHHALNGQDAGDRLVVAGVSGVIGGDRGGSAAGNAAAGIVLPGTLELEGGHDGCVVGFGVLAVGGEGEGFVVKDFVVDL